MIAWLQLIVYYALFTAVFLLCLYALVDAARRPPRAFETAGKRTKTFWMVLLGVATAVAFAALPIPGGPGMPMFLALGSAVAAGVYLADVRPAIRPYSGGPGGAGGSGRPRGW